MRHSLLIILLGVWSQATIAGFAQNATPGKSVDPAMPASQKNDEKIFSAKLDQLIAEALKYNPDIRVAEAKLREAEAELNRSRIRVIADLRGVLAEIEAAEASMLEGLSRWKTAEKLFKSGNLGREDYGAAMLTYEKLKGELIAKQIRLPYLLGDQVGTASTIKLINETVRKVWEQNVKDTAITDDEFIRRAMLDILGRTPRVDEIVKFKALPAQTRRQLLLDELQHAISASPPPAEQRPSVDSSVAAALKNPVGVKLRKALDMPIKLTGDNLSQAEVMNHIRGHLNPVNLHVRHKAAKDRVITVTFKEPIPVGAFVQFLEDELQCYFILRDYGVVVVSADDKLPPGALRVTDFWKQSTASDAHESKLEIARTQVKGPLTNAIQAYYLKHNAIWPPNLDALLQKYLENADSITDPWGKRYQYDLNGPKNNGTKPDIWTIAPGGTVIGNWDENEKSAPKENDAKFPNPPPTDIKGSIENVDPKDPTLVQISVGSAAGLKVGHTMDAYRLTPAPKYLGMLRITNVTNEKSVGRILALGNREIPNVRAGDQVASKLAKEKK